MATGGQGFVVEMDTVRAYHALNKDRKDTYLVMKLSDDGKKVVIESKGPAKKKATKLVDKNKHWDDLATKLPADQIRYVVAQVDYKDAKGTAQNDLVFVSWVPDGVNIMKQMEVDKEKAGILKCLSGLKLDFKASKTDDLKIQEIVTDKLKGKLD